MKKTLIAFLVCCPLVCMGQSEWETPNANKKQTEIKESMPSNEANKEIKDWKYIQKDAVPEQDGKVVFSADIEAKGKNAQQIYNIIYNVLDTLAKSENQIRSGIALINKKEHIIAAKYSEWLTFSKNVLALDRTKFNYTIVATCTDNLLNVTLSRISYDYEEDRPTGFHASAEKMINDKNAVNKKRTKLIVGNAKFRRKTIDRKDQIFDIIKKSME